MSDRVVYTIEDGVADVRMNRPEKMNALDAEQIEALVETGKELAEMKSVRAIVLSGEGRAFCAGLDFSGFRRMADRDSSDSAAPRQERDFSDLMSYPAYVWNVVPVPVIAAVHGVAFGGGLQIALGADIRFIAPDAQMSVMEIKWGLVPDMTGTQTMRHLVRLDVAKEMTFTGKIINGEEAVQLGFATHVSENPLESARALAHEIASKSPDAIRAAKKLMNSSRMMDLVDGLKFEVEMQRTAIGKPNQGEAVRANIERRDPNFIDVE